jgi:uncharacterized protein (TIGR02145 family)
LGGEDVAGAKLKETGTTHWQSPLVPGATNGATNESGFTALPGGNCYYFGEFGNIGGYGYYWSSKEYSATEAWFKYMSIEFSNFGSSTFAKKYGYSVRCLKD